MSYYSRVYRQRNPKQQDESKEKPFFSKQKQDQKSKRNNSFFQAKLTVNKPGDNYEKEADSVADSVINLGQGKSSVQKKEKVPIQRLATTPEEEKVSSNDERMERDKEKPFQRKPAEQEQEKEKEKVVQKKDEPLKEKEKTIQKVDDPLKEKEKAVQKQGEDEKEEKIQKKEDPLKEKEKVKS